MNTNDAKTSLANELAKERNRQSSDRTLMAWIRTAISLIGFGLPSLNPINSWKPTMSKGPA